MNRKCSPTFGVSLVWGAIILAAAILLKDTPHLNILLPILGGGGWIVITACGRRKDGQT